MTTTFIHDAPCPLSGVEHSHYVLVDAPVSPLEAVTIEAAKAYASVNGFGPDDKAAVGLVLAGMALMAASEPAVAKRVLAIYLAQFPAARSIIHSWAHHFEAAYDPQVAD